MQFPTALAAVMRVIFILLFFVFDLLPVVDAQTDAQNFFVNPTLPGPNQAFSANPAWDVGSTQTIKWSSNYENFTINLWQQDLGFQGAALGPGPTIFCNAGPLPFPLTVLTPMISAAKANYDKDVDQFDWVVQTFNFALSESNVFFLWLTTPGVGGITSHYFNISKEATSSSSSSSSISSSTSASRSTSSVPSTSSSSAASSSDASLAAPATNPTQTASVNNGLTNGAKIGIGVGASFGGVILLLLLAVVVLMLKKLKKRRQSPPSSFMSDKANRSFPGKRPPQANSQELDDNQTPAATDKSKPPSWQRVELE
jgi:hypothetical protein